MQSSLIFQKDIEIITVWHYLPFDFWIQIEIAKAFFCHLLSPLFELSQSGCCNTTCVIWCKNDTYKCPTRICNYCIHSVMVTILNTEKIEYFLLWCILGQNYLNKLNKRKPKCSRCVLFNQNTNWRCSGGRLLK